MKNYNELTTTLQDHTNELCVELLNDGIIIYTDMESILLTDGPLQAEMMLAKISNHLYSGNTDSFYKMLSVLKRYSISFAKLLIREVADTYKELPPAGRLVAEREVLMKNYSELTRTLQDHPVEMCMELCNADIITHADMDSIMITGGPRQAEMILAKISSHLHSGNTDSFYIMLSVLQTRSINFVKLQREVLDTYKELSSAGRLVAEREVLMKNFSELTRTLQGHTDELCMELHHAGVITDTDMEPIMITGGPLQADMILAKISSHLYSGNTDSFYKMLLVMQQYDEEFVNKLLREVLVTYKELPSGRPLEVFMLHYDMLMECLMAYTDEICMGLSDAQIITPVRRAAIMGATGSHKAKMLLHEVAKQLCVDNSESFYKMLDIMQLCERDDNIQQLLIKMRASINSPDVKASVGTMPNKEVCPFSASKWGGIVSSQIFDHHGGSLYIEEHDVTITVPEFAVSEGDKVEIQAAANVTGPYKLPDDCDPISVFVWMGADYKFKKPVKVTVPHFAVINEISDLFVLTASARDVVKDGKEHFQFQMFKSDNHYQFDVGGFYCDYYTDSFCSKCLARSRSFFSKLLRRRSLSPSRELPHTGTTRVVVFFCVPEDYATLDEMLIELCVCYDLKCCMETVEKSYSQRNMLSKKSAIVKWNITIDRNKSQKFSLSCIDCPGWNIEPVGSDKFDVSELDFHVYNSEDLEVQERLHLYPPRFKVSVNRLRHGRNLVTKFKIMLESNDASLSDEFKQFPLTIIQLDSQVAPDNQQITDPDPPAGNSATATNMICPLSAADSSIVSSEASKSLARANMGSNLLSTLPVAGNTFVKQNVMIVQGDVSIGSPPEQSIAGAENKFNSLQSFAAVLSNVDVATILPYLVTHGLLTQGQLGYLNFANYTTVQKQEKLTSVLLGLDENGVTKFLQCLSKTSDYEPHRQLLEDIRSKMAEETDDESVL